jgi:hypothetical protein
MRQWQQTLTRPDVQSAWLEPRFFWVLTRTWQEAKVAGGLSPVFWSGLRSHLTRFDEANPDGHRPATLALAHPPQAPLSLLQEMVAGTSTPRRRPAEVAPASTSPAPARVRPSMQAPAPEVPGTSVPVGTHTHTEPSPAPRNRRLTPANISVPAPTQARPASPSLAQAVAGPSKPSQKKGKGKMVVSVEETAVETDEETVRRVRKAPVASGQRRERPCRRCVRTGRECLERAGKGVPGKVRACLGCASVKMRCDGDDEGSMSVKPTPARPEAGGAKSVKFSLLVTSSDDEGPKPAVVNRSRPATGKKMGQAKRTTKRPAPTTPTPTPAPSSTASTPAPAPATPLPRRKGKGKGKALSPPIASSDESQDGYLNHRPESRPTFRELEKQCGMSRIVFPCKFCLLH